MNSSALTLHIEGCLLHALILTLNPLRASLCDHMVAETRQRHEWDTLSEFDETALIDALGMRAGRMSRTLPDYNG